MIRRTFLLLFLLAQFIIVGCWMKDNKQKYVELQLTSGKYGHFLNPVQSFSLDENWIAYDTRNEDPHIGQTGRIERVDLQNGVIDTIYMTRNQRPYGPGVGAVAYSPVRDQVVFIHGIKNADKNRPYGTTRRTGVGVSLNHPGEVIHYDARDIIPPFTLGALRGGSHAHSWSGDGTWLSFTYNDEVIAKRSTTDTSIQDLRTVGVMAPWGSVEVKKDDQGENNDGALFSMIVTRVTEDPENGSDEISKAYEDGWIGRDGYTDSDGRRHSKSIAFLGDVRDLNGRLVTEVFVVDLPENMPDLDHENQLKGDVDSRPQPLSMVQQRRVTHTADRKYPGVQGPRQWMKSSPNGSLLYFMMKDDQGIVQLFSVPTIGGEIRQITKNDFSIETAFDIDPAGNRAAYGSGKKIYMTNLDTGATSCITPTVSDQYSDLRAIQWSPSGLLLAYNRKVVLGDTAFFQIFTLAIDEIE